MEKLIKSITTSKYTVELHQDGVAFKIKHGTKKQDEPHTSEKIFDYKMADFMFNSKIEDYEGH